MTLKIVGDVLKRLSFIFILLLFLTGCGQPLIKENPVSFQPNKIEKTPLPDDSILNEIEEMKKEIGEVPSPIIINDFNGRELIAFTKEDFKKIIAKNEYTKFLEKLVKLQHMKEKLYVQQINGLKVIHNLSQEQLISMEQLYINAKNESISCDNKLNRTQTFWKTLTGAQTLVIIGLALASLI